VSTARLSELSEDLERRLRVAAAAHDPEGKGGVSGVLNRVLRPVVRRYERTAIELATIQTALAQRLERAERELDRLSHPGDAPQSGSVHPVEDDEAER
jgi:hypothetical protein